MYKILVIVGHRDGCSTQVISFDNHAQASTALLHLENAHDRLPDTDVMCIPLWETIES